MDDEDVFAGRDTLLNFGGSVSVSFAKGILDEKTKLLVEMERLILNSTFMYVPVGHEENYRYHYCQVLRRALFVSAWGFLEALTADICDELGQVCNQRIRACDLKERSPFEKGRRYVQLILDKEYPSGKLWESLQRYRKLRNEITHGARAISCNVNGVAMDEYGIINLDEHFWTSFVEFSDSYIDEWQEVIGSVSTRARLFVKKQEGDAH